MGRHSRVGGNDGKGGGNGGAIGGWFPLARE